MRRFALFALAFAAAAAAQEPGRVTSEVHVGRILVDARVVDPHGDAIPDLGPDDFRATLAGRPAVVEAAEWIPAAAAEAPPVTADGVRNPPGRVLVFFVQAGLRASQMTGLLRAWHAAAPLLDSLLPTDRVAVLAYGGHLRVVQDFTADRSAVREALRRALFGGPGAGGEPAGFPSLAESLGSAALAGTGSVDRALEALAGALGAFGGAKSVIFLGWGVAVNHAPSEHDALARAAAGLRAARAAVISLDATDADAHSLQQGLETVSAVTGGFYASLRSFPRQALARAAQALAGRYVLTLVAPEGVRGPVGVTLARRRGDVLLRE